METRPRKLPSGSPKLHVRAAECNPFFREKDRFSCRCRLSKELLVKFSICIGDVLILRFVTNVDTGSSIAGYFTAPMTVWSADSSPSSSVGNAEEDNAIIVDLLSFYPQYTIDRFSYCEILEVHTSRGDCSSVLLSYSSSSNNSKSLMTDLLKKQIKSHLLGKAVCKGLSLFIPTEVGGGGGERGSGGVSPQGIAVTVDYAAVSMSSPCGLVGMDTIISWSSSSSLSSSSSSIVSTGFSSSSAPQLPQKKQQHFEALTSYSWTPAVTAIADAFNIRSPFSPPIKISYSNNSNNSTCSNSLYSTPASPSAVYQSNTRRETFATSGLLLLGPPGTGKTFSVKALQHLCISSHDIQIFELNIPNIMAASSPIDEVNSVVAKAILFSQYKDENIPIKRVETSSSRSSSNSGSSSENADAPKKFSFSNPSSSKISSNNAFAANSTNKITISVDKQTDGRIKMSFVIIDEIDALGTVENHTELQAAVKSRIFDLMDTISYNKIFATSTGVIDMKDRICFIGTSNRSTDVDGSFRRGGRLEKEVILYDTSTDRKRLIYQLLVKHQQSSIAPDKFSESTLLNSTIVSKPLEFMTASEIEAVSSSVAEKTGGYVTADLVLSVFPRAADIAGGLIKRQLCNDNDDNNGVGSSGGSGSGVVNIGEASEINLTLIWENSFTAACQEVPSSSLRGIAVTLPKLSFDDVIGNEEAKLYLTRVMQMSNFKFRSLRKVFNIEPMGGVLLHGPPGNSKTRLVTAAAATYKLPLITLSVADVYSPYVGDAEAEIRKAFVVARRSSPCVMFLDEIDALVTNRDQASASGSGSNSVESRVLSTLLNEMDGVGRSHGDSGTDSEGNSGIIVVAATNRLAALDSAILRKGRFQNIILVDSPTSDNQLKLVDYFGARFKLNTEQISEVKKAMKPKISGAEIENLCREQMMSLWRLQLPP